MTTPDAPPVPSYTCRFCRMSYALPPGTLACLACGSPVDVAALVSRSGWEKQPPIADMTRLQFGRSHVQISGTSGPMAEFRLAPEESVYFPHHALLWSDTSTRLSNHPNASGWNRLMAGMPSYMLDAHGPGQLAVSDNRPGEIVAIPLTAQRPIWVREHHFLAASGSVDYTYQRSGIWYQTGSGDDRETHYPVGIYDDVYGVGDGFGLLLLHSPGDVFTHDLQPGETKLVQPTSLLYRDLSVQMSLHLEYPQSQQGGFFGRMSSYSHRMIWLRLTGPGRVAVHSHIERPEASGSVTGGTYTLQKW